MEGDLLEVTLDETQHIWKLLQACHVHADGRFLDFQVSWKGMDFGWRGGGVFIFCFVFNFSVLTCCFAALENAAFLAFVDFAVFSQLKKFSYRT